MKNQRKIRLQQLLESLAVNYESRSELAKAMGIPIQAVGTYFRGESFPDHENLAKIAQFLNISVFQLAAQLEGRELSATRSQPEKAEDIIPIAAQLPDSEKLALLKYLVNTLEYA
jgi:transcriptional regulator with XRE-family HTH domain